MLCFENPNNSKKKQKKIYPDFAQFWRKKNSQKLRQQSKNPDLVKKPSCDITLPPIIWKENNYFRYERG